MKKARDPFNPRQTTRIWNLVKWTVNGAFDECPSNLTEDIRRVAYTKLLNSYTFRELAAQEHPTATQQNHFAQYLITAWMVNIDEQSIQDMEEIGDIDAHGEWDTLGDWEPDKKDSPEFYDEYYPDIDGYDDYGYEQ